MTVVEQPSRADLIAMLRHSKWEISGEGPIGEMWSSPSQRVEVGIPFALSSANYEWSGVLDRIAYAHKTTRKDLARRIANLRFDVTDFRVKGPNWDTSVPVEAGFNLFKTARQVLRASATTAKSPKVAIGGGYSRIGDRVLEKARFGQTAQGSYIVPLMVPVLGIQDFKEDEHELKDGEPVFNDVTAGHETDERRTTRTMAESMIAVHSAIIDRDKPPTMSQVNDLVYAGVSRELLTALTSVVSKDSVTSFDATFMWSELLTKTSDHLKSSVSFPSEARKLLEESTVKFKPSLEPKSETFTGPIVQLRDEAIVAHGYVTIETNRNGRQVEMQVRVDERHLDEVHGWFKDRETVRVQGSVRRASSRLIIDKPTEFTLLRDSLLFDTELG